MINKIYKLINRLSQDEGGSRRAITGVALLTLWMLDAKAKSHEGLNIQEYNSFVSKISEELAGNGVDGYSFSSVVQVNEKYELLKAEHENRSDGSGGEFFENTSALEFPDAELVDFDLARTFMGEAIEIAQLSPTLFDAFSDSSFLLAQAEASASNGASAASTGATASAGSAATSAGAASSFGLSSLGILIPAGIYLSAQSNTKISQSLSSSDSAVPSILMSADIESLTSSATAKTISLKFNEALDANHLPSVDKFTIKVGGVLNSVVGVSVNGDTLTLTLQNAFTTGALISIKYVDDPGDQVNTIQDLMGIDALGFSVSKLADGYIKGAQIYLDANGDGVADKSEKLEGIVTDAQGNFFLPSNINPNNYSIIAIGGINTDSGLVNTFVMRAPAGSTAVNPLTTMVQTILSSNVGMSLETAQANLVASLGLKAGTDLTSYDPISVMAAGSDDEKALALGAQKVAAQIVSIVSLGSAGDAAASIKLISNISNLLNDSGKTGNVLSLSSSDTLASAYAGVTISDSAKKEVAAATQKISVVNNLTDLVQTQKETGATVRISGDTAANLTEADASLSTSGKMTTNSTSSSLFAAQTDVAGNNGYGKFTVTTAGVWTYTMNTAHNEFVSGTNYTDSITVRGADGTSTTLTVIIKGSNDAAVISGTSTASLSETNAIQTATGTLTSADVDGTANLFAAQTDVAGNNGYGKFTVTTAGVWTYTMNTAHNEFVSGTNYTDSITVKSTDGTEKVVTVTITGTDDPITMTLASGGQDAYISDLVARIDSNLYEQSDVDVIDLVSNAVTLTDAQAQSLVSAGIEFATDDTGVAVQAVGTHLTTSLSDLQKLGVDVVNVGMTSGEFVIAAGSGAIDFSHLPTVKAGSGVTVGLEISDAALNGISAAAMKSEAISLTAAGFDELRIADSNLTVDSSIVKALHEGGLVFAAQDQITMTVVSNTQGYDIADTVARIDSGLYAQSDVDVIDLVSNGVTITDAQAQSLVSAGIEFATDDTGVAVQAVGTHLTTSLSDLQKLGVDIVNVGVTSGEFVIAAGSGAIDVSNLPTFNAAPGVTLGLEITSSNLDGLTGSQVVSKLQTVHTAGFEDLRVNVDSSIVSQVHNAGLVFAEQDQITMSVASNTQSTDITDTVARIDSHLYAQSDVDVIDLVSNGVTLTDAQAQSLVSAGIEFATDDTGVAVQAVGTHLTTSLSDLQKLGVDVVHTDASAVNTVVLGMGTGTFADATLPVFDTADNVQLNVLDTQLSSLETLITNNANAAGIDVLSVVLNEAIGDQLAGLGVLDPSLYSHGLSVEIDVAFATNAVTLGMILDAADGDADPLALLNGQSLADALVAAGINDIKIDQITSFEVSDTDLKPLMDAGLIIADADADITVEHSGVGTLDVTLAQLAAIGADHVIQTDGSNLVVDAGVTFTNLTQLESALNDLLANFEDSDGVINKQLFIDASSVDLHVAGTLPGSVLSTALADQLTLIGIDQVLDDDGNVLKPAPV